jgi:hypothetical protein
VLQAGGFQKALAPLHAIGCGSSTETNPISVAICPDKQALVIPPVDLGTGPRCSVSPSLRDARADPCQAREAEVAERGPDATWMAPCGGSRHRGDMSVEPARRLSARDVQLKVGDLLTIGRPDDPLAVWSKDSTLTGVPGSAETTTPCA